MCPEVRCPAVSANCETIEYIVFEYDYEVRGRVINVRCESCEYCLDAPAYAAITSRRRRSSTHLTLRSGGDRANHVSPADVTVFERTVFIELVALVYALNCVCAPFLVA